MQPGMLRTLKIPSAYEADVVHASAAPVAEGKRVCVRKGQTDHSMCIEFLKIHN